MAKLTDILSDITQNEMSKKLMRMTEAEINAIPSHALTESISKLEEFAGRSAPRKREEQSPEELASINQARANAGLPAIKPKVAPVPAPVAPIDPAIAQRKSNMDIERDAALAAARAELNALMAKPKVKPAQTGVKALPSQDSVSQSWTDDAGVDIAPDMRSLATRKTRVSSDDEQDIYAPTDADDSRTRLGLDEEEIRHALKKLQQKKMLSILKPIFQQGRIATNAAGTTPGHQKDYEDKIQRLKAIAAEKAKQKKAAPAIAENKDKK